MPRTNEVCDEASFFAKVGCPWSIAPGAADWVGVDPPGVSDGKGQCADGGRTGDADPVRKGHLVLVSEYGPSQRPAGGQPFSRRRELVRPLHADNPDGHRRLSLECP